MDAGRDKVPNATALQSKRPKGTQHFAKMHRAWKHQNPKHLSFPAHGEVVTCLLISHGRIISASNDHSIRVDSLHTGALNMSLDGHQGGVWGLAATKDSLVSGSTDRTVRIWDLTTGKCTHVFGGHKGTVRCLAIVKPEWLDVKSEDGVVRREKWPRRPLIITGSRDHSLMVWLLPRPGEGEYRWHADDDNDPTENEVKENPYYKLHLEGHGQEVRALAARGRTLVSGSYDHTVRVWDIITGACKWVLVGHMTKVYDVVLDPTRGIAASGSMDHSVRIWNLQTGQCQHTLTRHTSLVGLLGLSVSYLVSGSADGTLMVSDPDTGELRHRLVAHKDAVTCFQHDEFKVLSGSSEALKMWDIRDGALIKDLLIGSTNVWRVAFKGRWCVAASTRQGVTMLDAWEFGTEEIEATELTDTTGLYDDGSSDDEEGDEEALMTDATDKD